MNTYIIKVKNYYERTEAPRIVDSRFGFVIKELFKKGFVFTDMRLTNLEYIEIYYPRWYRWNDIVIGDDECKRVLHVGEDYIFCRHNKTSPKIINIRTFLRIKNYEN